MSAVKYVCRGEGVRLDDLVFEHRNIRQPSLDTARLGSLSSLAPDTHFPRKTSLVKNPVIPGKSRRRYLVNSACKVLIQNKAKAIASAEAVTQYC